MSVSSKWLASAAALILAVFTAVAAADAWRPIRTGAGTVGWQQVACDRSGQGWRSCNMGLTIVIQANPGSVAAVGEQANLVATVTDYNGTNVGKDVKINWSTSDGSQSASSSITDANGQTSVILTSSRNIGSATVTAPSPEEGGTGQLTVPFTDKWAATSAVYTAWLDSGGAYNCSAWTPDPSTVTQGTAFTQSAICSQNQVAYQQNREVSLITGQVRNVGSPIPLYQTIQVSVTQQATGTKQGTPSCIWSSSQRYGVYSKGWTRTVSQTGGSRINPYRLYLGDGTVVGSVNALTDTLTYNGRVYSIGRFKQSGCMGKNCASMRDEYEACSTPL